MFTGIIEKIGEVLDTRREESNTTFTLRTTLDEALRVDQSLAHDGVCLTVVKILKNSPGEAEYEVTAIAETLSRTCLGRWHTGSKVNVERCLRAGARLDGHFVQGHVDSTGTVMSVSSRDGSWLLEATFDDTYSHLLVEKGSITINGVSLTVVEAGTGRFSVALIPFTWEHTNFHLLRPGDPVNLEFDILGKYISRMMELRGS